ncbi:serine protease [Motiliproteus coralliicola]|uniref:Serine protease n=2 Tax=Motiliproteus coralliicola TaxID=2283196 RepID=A0A369WUK3_9GAMM|nr:serine protease [Motiliproteus coralliicola]
MMGLNQLSWSSGLPNTLSKIKPSILGVGTYQPTRRPPSRFLGTGFVVGDGSYVVTNAHVVNVELDSNNRERLAVFAGSGKATRMYQASISIIDRNHDLAILKISRKFPALTLSSGAEVREGEVYAFTGFPIGSVLGLYPVTHRGMIASITPMAIPSPSSAGLNARKIRRLREPITTYQLDAISYPGNSGSPLYNMETGEVIGILNQVYVKSTKEDILSSPSGISYAIPIEYLNILLKRLLKKDSN